MPTTRKTTTTGQGSGESVAGGHDEHSQDCTSKDILDAIATLSSDVRASKTEIGEMIDRRFEQFSISIRRELSALKNETNSTLATMKATVDKLTDTMV